ncbi:MAG: hypothetical protein ACRDJC_10875 [Thermomicrobiales bacterium]
MFRKYERGNPEGGRPTDWSRNWRAVGQDRDFGVHGDFEAIACSRDWPWWAARHPGVQALTTGVGLLELVASRGWWQR